MNCVGKPGAEVHHLAGRSPLKTYHLTRVFGFSYVEIVIRDFMEVKVEIKKVLVKDLKYAPL